MRSVLGVVLVLAACGGTTRPLSDDGGSEGTAADADGTQGPTSQGTTASTTVSTAPATTANTTVDPDPTTVSTSGVDGGSDSEGVTTEGVENACLPGQTIPPLPDCSGADLILAGDVIIEEGGADPSALLDVRRVEGNVIINRVEVTDLDFMACLEEVTGEVTIFGNEALTNVDGLGSLSVVGDDFIFSENTALVDFDGLPRATMINGSLVLKNNDSLEGISGFASVEHIEGNFVIQNNDALEHIDGLGGLRVINGTLAIVANPQLCMSSVNCVASGIEVPRVPPVDWTTQGNNDGC